MTDASFSGIYPMLYAFFDKGNKLDRDAMRQQVNVAISMGANGIGVLGLATEVNKLSVAERRLLIDWSVEDIAGRVPLAVTIAGDTVEEQRALASYATQRGADWLILQPPSGRGKSEAFYADFFAAVMAGMSLPTGIQNAPEYLGFGLGPDALFDLAQRCPQFRLLKAEGPSVVVRETIDRVSGLVTVFNGRDGLEAIDNLTAGCAGIVVTTTFVDLHVAIYDRFQRGDLAQAEVIYRRVLPAIVFVMQSLDTLTCYGKRIAAWRMGLPDVVDRAPALAPTAFGLAAARRFTEALDPMPCAP